VKIVSRQIVKQGKIITQDDLVQEIAQV